MYFFISVEFQCRTEDIKSLGKQSLYGYREDIKNRGYTNIFIKM